MDETDAQPPWQRLGSKFTLGLRSRAEADWLPHDDAFGNHKSRADQLSRKASLLDTSRHEVFACDGTSLAACAEVRDMVKAHLETHHDGRSDGDAARLSAHSDMHPLEQAARAVPEDLLVLAPRNRAPDAAVLDWVLVSAALAFPAHWVLAEKMGRPLAGIHEPVPHYEERLERPMDRFFTAMTVGPISHRWNWSVSRLTQTSPCAASSALALFLVAARAALTIASSCGSPPCWRTRPCSRTRAC